MNVYIVTPFKSTSEKAPIAFLDLDKALVHCDDPANTDAEDGFLWIDSIKVAE